MTGYTDPTLSTGLLRALHVSGPAGEHADKLMLFGRFVEGDFTEQDEANLVRLATLTSVALDALAQLHLPEYREKVGTQSSLVSRRL